MVRFLLENSLGAWWAARHPDSPLVKEFEYLRFDEDGQPAAGTFDGWPDAVAEVTVMDPCCGSGHFLVEAFGMLWRMRVEEEGLDPVTAQDAVLSDNLFGLELDPRCVQIAMFAVALTAWKQGDGWRELPTPNIACSGIPAKSPLEEWTALADGDPRLEQALERLHALFKDADTLGSLIDPRRAAELDEASGQLGLGAVDFDEIAPLLEKAAARETNDPATAVLGADAAGIARAATLLSRRYTLTATNVPYLAASKQKESLRSHSARHYANAKADLATTMLARCWAMSENRGSFGALTPEKLLFLGAYKAFRSELLERTRWSLMTYIGPRGFSTPMYDLGIIIGLWSNEAPSPSTVVHGLSVKMEPDWLTKMSRLPAEPLLTVPQTQQLSHPDARFSFENLSADSLLSAAAESRYGLRTGDAARLIHYFWEHPAIGSDWIRHQSTPSDTKFYSGRESVLLWLDGGGPLHDLAQVGIASIQGEDAWGQRGVAVKLSGDLTVTIYEGTKFDNNTGTIWPKSQGDLAALWTFCSSANFSRLVRELDNSLKVTNQTLLKVPFERERWRAVAAEEFPEGLPEPWSDDPTQWLFEGRPEVATEPLQVGVGRLVGYRWPEQPEDDGLDGHADADGIVCLPAVRGEPPAADRLSALLADAFGDSWSPGLAGKLLEEAGSTKKSLADWLRDDFFKHHCKVFSNRPFVWHIWDGRKDGFAALVNYHRLDRAGLEKLTYTYLGDWIERQEAAAADGVAGADLRLAAALELRGKFEAILEGEPPFDIYVRWKSLDQQPIGWDPDLDDGVRLNIRPFVEAGVLRSKVNVHWRKDRGKNPDGSERHNDLHYTNDQKRQARQEAGTG